LIEARPRDICLNVGVSDAPGTLRLREYANEFDGWSTFSEDIASQADHQAVAHVEYDVEVRTLTQIFTDHGVTEIDFLKVDAEGFEEQVLRGNDWKLWRPRVVAIENAAGSWREIMVEAGYHEAFYDGLNHYFVPNGASYDYLVLKTMLEAMVGRGAEFGENWRLSLDLLGGLTGTQDDIGHADEALQHALGELERIRQRPEEAVGGRRLAVALVRRVCARAKGFVSPSKKNGEVS
jgi:FkbM family methyltransferase